MTARLVFAALVLCTALASSEMTFEEYIQRFNKQYDTHEEFILRRTIFEARIKEISEHNHSKKSHFKAVNHMTDMTEAEFKQLLGFDRTLHNHRKFTKLENSKYLNSPLRPRLSAGSLPIPDSVDWAKANATTPVKNQGGCGSCWAFAGVEAIESDIYLETGKLPVLSPQQYVDCVSNSDECGGSGGCQGSVPDLLFQYAITQGARNESEYSYRAQEGVCMAGRTTSVAAITGWVDVISNDITALKLAVAKQPVTIGVAANSWGAYGGGVVKFEDCDADINHAVIVVGYGTDPVHGPYWKVQNSWGPGWGEEGFIRLDMNEGCQMDKTPAHGLGCKDGPAEVEVCGTCGILYAPSYPVGGHML